MFYYSFLADLQQTASEVRLIVCFNSTRDSYDCVLGDQQIWVEFGRRYRTELTFKAMKGIKGQVRMERKNLKHPLMRVSYRSNGFRSLKFSSEFSPRWRFKPVATATRNGKIMQMSREGRERETETLRAKKTGTIKRDPHSDFHISLHLFLEIWPTHPYHSNASEGNTGHKWRGQRSRHTCIFPISRSVQRINEAIKFLWGKGGEREKGSGNGSISE